MNTVRNYEFQQEFFALLVADFHTLVEKLQQIQALLISISGHCLGLSSFLPMQQAS
jgi:hypothetical protein